MLSTLLILECKMVLLSISLPLHSCSFVVTESEN